MTQSGWHGSAAVYRVDRSLRISRIRMHRSWGSARFRVLSVHLEKWMFTRYLFKEAQGSVSGSVCCIVSGIAWKMDTVDWLMTTQDPQRGSAENAYRRGFWPRPPAPAPVCIIEGNGYFQDKFKGKPTMPQEARYQTWTPGINTS